MRDRERQIDIQQGVKLRYRLNRGDIQGIREVWLDAVYTLPSSVPGDTLVDLGANIGLTSVWLTLHYDFKKVIAVEPDPRNAALVRANFKLNNIDGTVVEAAVGPRDETARFQTSNSSNLGALSQVGIEVAMISMSSILKQIETPQIDLLKMDIEGGEQQLLTGPLDWLDRTKAIIAEFHPTVVDYRTLTSILTERGFHYLAANTVFTNNMDYFGRDWPELSVSTQIPGDEKSNSATPIFS